MNTILKKAWHGKKKIMEALGYAYISEWASNPFPSLLLFLFKWMKVFKHRIQFTVFLVDST